MSTYLLPAAWWWGEGLLSSITSRWSLVAALIFAAGALLDQRPRQAERSARPALLYLLLLYALNATVVHFTVADDAAYAWLGFTEVLNKTALVFVLLAAIKDEFDLRLMVWSIVLCSAIIGLEVVLFGAGKDVHGRLEGIRAVGANDANSIPALLSMAIPLGGYLLFCGSRLEKCAAAVSLVFVLEAIVRCVSRVAFLGLIGGAAWLLFVARGRFRKYAVAGILLALTAAFVQTKGALREAVLGRFSSTFAPEEERDSAAQSRIDYWRQGMKMVRDHPLGSGFNAAFRSIRGLSYMEDIGIEARRSVHNGYIDVAASWGLQGLVPFLAVLALAWRRLRASVSHAEATEGASFSFLGRCLEATLVTQLIVAMFVCTLDAEWNWCWIAMAVAYPRILPESVSGEPSEGDVTDKGPQTG
jgi:O-antigen ligase